MKHRSLNLCAIFLFVMSLTELKAQTIKDIDGNVYSTVTIGSQTWMKENLKTTRYNNKTAIALESDYKYDRQDYYCWYNNNKDSLGKIYGALYNWYAVNTNNLCPIGWHVPSDDEWTTLITLLGGEEDAGKKLREAGSTHWLISENENTNETGFTALPAGEGYYPDEFVFEGLGESGSWWSATKHSTKEDKAFMRLINYDYLSIYSDSENKNNFMSVRCIKNQTK